MRKFYIAVLLGGTALTPTLAHAQSSTGTTVEEIIVTAQRRETKIETTPMTINVVSGVQVEQQGVREIKDLKASVPGLTMNESPGGLSGVSVRGIGTSAGSQLFEQSVGLFVDGVYHPRARQFRDGLFDVERIEVIKGSQGVLFGKNTSVGAISIVSREPGDEFGGYLQGEYEAEYGGWTVQGAVDLPVSDRFQIRLSALHDDQNGWMRNVAESRDEPQEQRDLIRGVFSLDVTPQFKAVLKLQHSNYSATGNTFQWVSTTKLAALRTTLGVGPTVDPTKPYIKYDSSDASDGHPTGDTVDEQSADDHALTLTYDLPGGHVLTAITGYSKFNFTYGFDSDSTPNAWLLSQFNEDYEQLTQEVRIASPTGGAIDYIAGAFFMTADENYDYRGYYRGFAGVFWGLQSQLFTQEEKAYALFGEVNWHITPAMNLSVGARWSDDQKDATYTRIMRDDFGCPSTNLGCGLLARRIGDEIGTTMASPVLPTAPFSESVEDRTVDFSATLSYNLTDRSSLYASVGRGNKGSAFLNQAASNAPHPLPFSIPKEVANTYEIGIKGRFLEGRGYASLALYHLDITDYQDSFYNSAVAAFQVRSMDAKTSGLEFEGRFQVTDWLNVYGNLAYNPKAELANGERMQRAPKMTSLIGARVKTALTPDLELSGNVELLHSDTFLHQPASSPGDNFSGAYDLLSLRAQLTYRPLDLDVYVAGSNLTEELYQTFTFGSPTTLGQVGAYNAPRMIKVGVRKAF